MKILAEEWKRILAIIVFYLVNFGLWELIAPVVSGEWASFMVYVILFCYIILFYRKELMNEWKIFKSDHLKDKAFFFKTILFFVCYFLLSLVMLITVSKFNLDILPENNENVKNQMTAVPVALAMIQGCIFAPVIEEMVFRYSIVGKERRKSQLIFLCVLSLILFDCIHIVRISEFFYYLFPSVLLIGFYVSNKNNPFASMFLHSIINVGGYISLLLGIL